MSRVRHHPRRLLRLAFACALAVAASALEVVPPASATAGAVAVWEIRGAPAEWSDADVAKAPTLSIAGPDGRTWKRQAFAYREHRALPSDPEHADVEFAPTADAVLQVRHQPRVAGAHAWTLHAPDGAVLAQGEVQAGAPAVSSPPGPLRIAKHNRRLLSFADGTPFVPIGPNIAWADGPERLARFEGYLAKLEAAGGNHCRVWMASWFGQIESTVSDRWRLDHAWLVDQVLAAARRHGVRVTLVLDNHHDLVHGKCFPYGETTLERQERFIAAELPPSYLRRLRYVVARWGCDDTILAWELFNELDMAQPVREKCLPWARSAAAALRRIDPDARLRTISWCGEDFSRIAGIPDLDLAQVHSYVLEWADPSGEKKAKSRDAVRMLLEPMEVAGSLAKPFCFGELGYQGERDANQGNDLDERGLLLRQQAWAGLMLGGYGSGMHWWWDVWIDKRGLWDQYRGLAKTVKRVDWSDPGLSPLLPNAVGEKALVMGWVAPRQALIWPHPRADTWHAHLVDGQPRQGLTAPVRIALAGFAPGQAFTVRWLDMATGEERARDEVVAQPVGRIVLQVQPPGIDRVALVLPAEK